MAGIAVRPVRTARERRLFLTFPWRIYRGDPLWVPPLIPERAKKIDPRRNPLIRADRLELFIAWENDRPAGTVCIAEDAATNKTTGRKDCLFGFFECREDIRVAEALIQAAEKRTLEFELDTLFGPFNLDYEDSYGVLIEGREHAPVIYCGHSPPYYRTFFEKMGFKPARADNVAYLMDLHGREEAWDRLSRLANRARRKGWITLRQADLHNWDGEMERIFGLINICLAHLDDFIPYSRETLAALIEPFAKIADPELILFAEAGNRTVGWFPAIPNLNETLLHANGLRYPWDYLRLLRHLNKQKTWLTIKSVLVLPDFWGSAVSALLFDEMTTRARGKGYRWIDLSLTSAANPYTPGLAERMGARIYKRYRVYTRRITRPAPAGGTPPKSESAF